MRMSSMARTAMVALAVFLGSTLAQGAEPTTKPVAKAYPLDTCIVSGKPLGSMGDAVAIVHEGQEIKFCCSGCVAPFKKEPQKYLDKLKAADSGPTTKPAD